MTVCLRILGSVAGFLLVLAACTTSGNQAERTGPVRISDLQFIGTHNSYHIQPDQAVFDLMRATGYRESARWTGPELEKALSFTHPPIRQQLDMGLRVFEFDVHDDPEGGRFAEPGFLKALDAEVAASLPPVDPDGELLQPGLKVFHTADTDVRSQCLRFVLCLQEIRDWSLAHPGHMPVFIQIETKEGRKPVLADAYEPADPAPFTRESWLRLHDEILGVFPRDSLFLPRDLQGRFSSVNDAVRSEGWPPVSELRGRVVFLLLDDPEPQSDYIDLIENGVEPLLFPSRNESDPYTAWLIRPKPQREEIRPLVEAGFLVYTRADANSTEARRGDASRAEEAVASGAQLISTDYPEPSAAFDGYVVRFGEGYVRCNTVIRRDGCAQDTQLAEK